MQQRYYDPGIGMFLSTDPVAAFHQPALGFHRYRYGNSSPYRFTDPDGRWGEDLVLGIPSIVIGGKNLSDNVSAGNYGAAVVDGVGIIVDAAAILTPGVPGGAGLGIAAIRMTDKVGNMAAFLKASDFGRSIAGSLSKTSKRVDGQSVYRVTENNGTLKKGDQIYLDGKHKDHFEVYDRYGRPRAVLNMDGTVNARKTEAAIEEGRRL